MPRTKEPQRATVDLLLKKAPRTKEIALGDDASAPTLLFQALSSKEYDALVSAHPPATSAKERGDVWNPDTFAPALVAACSVEPKISDEEAVTIFTSDSWSRGELTDLFWAVVRLNSDGLDVPFTVSD